MDANELGRNLHSARAYMRMTQRELEKVTGVSENTIVDIEAGRRLPNFGTVVKLLNALGFEVEFKRKVK
jgi:DNA-binding XRE family transcriptional regulator